MMLSLKSIVLFSSLIILFAIASCSKNNKSSEIINNEVGIVGTWIHDGFDETNKSFIYIKAAKLSKDRKGWIFKPNGDMIDRDNIGFCGTPPITYTDYESQWKKISNTKIEVDGKSWEGNKKYSFDIISITLDRLIVKLYY